MTGQDGGGPSPLPRDQADHELPPDQTGREAAHDQADRAAHDERERDGGHDRAGGAAAHDRRDRGPAAHDERDREPTVTDQAGREGAPDQADRESADAGGPHPRTVRAVRGTFAATLVLEALVVLLVPRTIAQFGDGLVGWKLALLLTLAGLLVLAAGLLGRPAGIRIGTALQLALLACGFLTAAMFVLGAVFSGIWFFLLTVRRDLLGVRLL